MTEDRATLEEQLTVVKIKQAELEKKTPEVGARRDRGSGQSKGPNRVGVRIGLPPPFRCQCWLRDTSHHGTVCNFAGRSPACF